jgi:hypothetical protein
MREETPRTGKDVRKCDPCALLAAMVATVPPEKGFGIDGFG